MWELKGEETRYLFAKRTYALRYLSMLGARKVSETSLDDADEYEIYIAKEFGKQVEYTLTFNVNESVNGVTLYDEFPQVSSE